MIALVQATFPNLDEARAVGTTLVTERLVACVNILAPCLSVYRWRDGVDTSDEAIAQFKTLPDRAPAVAARIAELHSYELPAIEWWPVTTDDAGERWVAESLGR